MSPTVVALAYSDGIAAPLCEVKQQRHQIESTRFNFSILKLKFENERLN